MKRLAPLCLLLPLVVACGGPRGGTEPTPERPEVQRGFLTESGEAIQRSAEDRRVIWEIAWRAAAVSIVGDEPTEGKLQEVSGRLYRDGEPVSEFQALEGVADGAREILTLDGRVEVREIETGATLRCDRLVYEGKHARLKAEGNVRLEVPGFTMGPMDAFWVTSDLQRGGTPDQFEP